MKVQNGYIAKINTLNVQKFYRKWLLIMAYTKLPFKTDFKFTKKFNMKISNMIPNKTRSKKRNKNLAGNKL